MAANDTLNQDNILFANLKQMMDNMIQVSNQQNQNLVTQCQQANAIVLQHTQNAVTSSDQLNKILLEQLRLGWGDNARLARELEPAEAIANRLMAEVYKLPTADYILAIKALADIIGNNLSS